jgi:metallo-beta-lactamase family protein
MKLKFHGPLGEVTGSCYELRDAELDVHFLVDYGMKQGVADAPAWNHATPPFDPKSLDFVLLTHAHLDHCGLIPLLYKCGFSGRVYCTRETAKLAEINLLDACKHDAPYSRKDVGDVRWSEPPEPVFNRSHYVYPDISVTFRRTAHMLGATSLRIEWGPTEEHKQITFSGDIGNNTQDNEFQPLMRHRIDPFEPRSKQSYVVMESTYGGQKKSLQDKNFGMRLERLRKHVERTAIEKEGTLIIPCFAIGRTQSVLFDLHYLFATHSELRDIPVLFDAGMARKVSNVYAKALRRYGKLNGRHEPMWLSDQLLDRMGLDPDSHDDRKLLGRIVAASLDAAIEVPDEARGHASEIIRNWERVWKLTSSQRGTPAQVDGPCIVVTGGGMCDGGPVVNYLSNLLVEERNTVLLTGYCCPRTNGGKLLQLKNESLEERSKRTGRLTWEGTSQSIELATICADIERIRGYSGHADHNGLLDWFFGSHRGRHYPAGWTVFLTHGNDDRRRKLAKGILQKARELDALEDWDAADLDIQQPDTSVNWYDLDTGDWILDAEAFLGEILPTWKRFDQPSQKKILDRLSATLNIEAAAE